MRNLFLLGAILMSAGHANAAVLEAVQNGDIAVLEQALSASAPVDERNAQGQTALLVAVWNDDVEAARRLIAAGADVNGCRPSTP